MLNPKKFGLAGGILWGLCMFACTILALYTGYAEMFLKMMGGIYPGYTISWVGGIIGLVYGFLDAFIGLYIFAWLYNKFTANEIF